MKRILVTGGRGQLGTELARYSWPQGWEATCMGSGELDLTDPGAVAATIADGSWAAVINGGAYTAVDQAEKEIAKAWAVNALGPAAVAQACALKDVPIVQVSTDYVFDGTKIGAWEVSDRVAPLGVYGASKLGGELAVSTSAARFAIVRTAWIVSAHGQNFLKTMLRLAAERDTVSVVADQTGSPTAAADLAATLATVAMTMADDKEASSGIYHFSNTGPTSWAEFATEIFAQSVARGGPTARVDPIATSAYPTLARRPANSLLAHSAIERDYNVVPRPWQDALSDILDDMIGNPK